MPGREVGSAQAVNVLERDAEFDFPVAEHVRIRCAACALLAQEILEDPLAILRGEAYTVQRDAELARHRARILKVLGGGAIRVVFVVPIAHEKRLDVVALFRQQESRDSGVHAAG
jgi:hypothetical protein